MFNFTSLLGAQTSSTASQSLLEFDGGVKILVDVGWDAIFDATKLAALEKEVPTLSLILLTHATIDHIGAYAHCCKHIPLFNQIPVYATTPVINLGRTLITDLYASTPLAAAIIPQSTLFAVTTSQNTNDASTILFEPPTLDEIASYFHQINSLKYSQPHQPIPSSSSPPLGNLTITAYNAGHTPGGTIWHIQHGLESIVYAVDWSQGRENLLSGAAWLGGAGGGAEVIEPLQRPTTLICSAKGVERTDTLPRRKRDDALLGLIRETIAQGGKVLIPTDTSARVLELAFVLNQAWHEGLKGAHAETFKQAKVFMASRTSTATIRQLQSMLEWMDETVISEAEAAMNRDKGDEKVPGVLDWQHVRTIEKPSQVERTLRRPGPAVMLASDGSLHWGFSKQAFEVFAQDARNLVLLVDTNTQSDGPKATPSQQLLQLWRERTGKSRAGASVVTADGANITLTAASVQDLNDQESATYAQYAARQRQVLMTSTGTTGADLGAVTETIDDQASDSSDSEEEDEDPEHQGRALNISVQMTQSNKRKVGLTDAELGVNILIKSKHVHDFDVRNKRGREKIFPFVPQRNRNDDFGDLIKPEEYLRAEERDDVDGVDMKEDNKRETTSIGQKRKWGDVTKNKADRKSGKAGKESSNKRVKGESSPDDIDALIARATGENGEGAENGEDGSDEESDYEPEDIVSNGPRKLVVESRSLSLQIRIAHVDYAGLHEKRDLQMLIPLIRPRKLILIAGTASETQSLSQECKQIFGDGEGSTEVFTPVLGETIDSSVDTNAWTLKLSRQLVKKLIWQNVKGRGIVTLTGRLTREVEDAVEEEEESAKKKLKLVKSSEALAKTNGDSTAALPVLDLIGSSTSGTASSSVQRTAQPVHVGDLRLADFRRLITASGHTAEFRGEGTLLIDSTVIVRKSVSGKIEVEAGAGGLNQPVYRTKENEGSFFAVRKLIYEGLAMVAGV